MAKTKEAQRIAAAKWWATRTPEQRAHQMAIKKAWREANKDKAKAIEARTRAKHRDQRLADTREWRANNQEYVAIYNKEWREKNPGYKKRRYDTEIQFNIKQKLRRRIYMALRNVFDGRIRRKPTIELLGCTYEEFKAYIEKQFTEGMTWDKVFNGEIHLDHVIPCAAFDLTDPVHQGWCFGYRNIQPLWKSDNLKKHDRIPEPEEILAFIASIGE